MKLTLWFSCKQKPVRVGWYDAAYLGITKVYRRWWDGRAWRFAPDDDDGISFGCVRGDKWRGVAKP